MTTITSVISTLPELLVVDAWREGPEPACGRPKTGTAERVSFHRELCGASGGEIGSGPQKIASHRKNVGLGANAYRLDNVCGIPSELISAVHLRETSGWNLVESRPSKREGRKP
jgi:hypothetical protein